MKQCPPIHEASVDTAPKEEADVLRECGARVAVGRVAVGGETVLFDSRGAETLGRDGYRIDRHGGVARIVAATRVARLSAVLELPELQHKHVGTVTRKLRFNHRNYKHEIAAFPGAKVHHLANYTETYWSAMCRQLVRRHFNGLVLYSTGDPFLSFADLGRFEQYATLPAETRAAYRDKLNMILRVSRRYGIETILQQYITHCPVSLGLAHNLPFCHPKSPGGTFADFKHPKLYAYLRALYRSFFKDCPDLDRLLLNFESAPVSSEFMREVLLPTLGGMRRVPKLFFRLWYVPNPRELCDWIEQYPGHCMVGHKIIDTMDAYCHPTADTRIREWKRTFRERGLNVDWNYLVGPCHNCGSNVSNRLWSDPEFIYTLLGRAIRLGTDGINFHTRWELLAGTVDDKGVTDKRERELARLNRLHLEAAVDVVRGGAFDEARVVDMHAEHFGLRRPAARSAYRALRDTSRAEILHLLQFPLTTHEGYATDSRRQLSQHPLYHPPANVLLNNQHRDGAHPFWCFVSKTIPARPYPNDLQTLIDYADPAKPNTRRNPEVLAREMVRLGKAAQRSATRLQPVMGPVLVEECLSNLDLAQACAHDIRAGIALFRVYFVQTRSVAIRHVDAALRELKALEKIVRERGAPYIHMQEPHDPAPDIAALRELKRCLSGKYPFEAFRAYATSRKLYNDIRRHVRPWRVWNDGALRKAAALLRRARGAAGRAMDLAHGSPQERHVGAWIRFLEAERAALCPPEFLCSETDSGWQPMHHDNCFGYGGFAWMDFLGFFKPVLLDKGLKQACRIRRTRRDFVLEVREDDVDMAARLAHWKAFEGHRDEAGFVRVFIDAGTNGRLLRNWSVFPRGREAVYSEMQIGGRQDFDSLPPRLARGCRTSFEHDNRSWRLSVRVAFSELGGAPKPGNLWQMQVATNTPIARNHAMAWCKGYEVGPGNPARMGCVTFTR